MRAFLLSTKSVKKLFLLFAASTIVVLSYAQPGSHDPSSIARDGDTYWIFNTNIGIGTVYAHDAEFSDWTVGSTVFGDTWPEWINDYVPDFAGQFWAPSVKYFNGKYHLYYSCSTMGAYVSAIGLATSSSLNDPDWEDQGMVVYSNSASDYNAIDPAIFVDDDGSVWMVYGSWHAGIAITEIDPSTGKTTGSVSYLAGGNAQSYEGPYLLKHGDYYYLFINRGLCCSGVSSTYYIIVGRSTSVTGPYEDFRTFKSSQGKYIGPGHIGYGEDRLTYHYYDGNDAGIAKVANTTLEWSDGWPVAGSPSTGEIVQIRNRATGLYLDGMGRTTDGEACGQYANVTDDDASWVISFVNENFQFTNVGTGLILTGSGDTVNGASTIQASDSSDTDAQWEVVYYEGHFYRVNNANTGMYLDGYGLTDDGSDCKQYANTTHVNAQWEIISVGSGIVSGNTYYINPRSGNSLTANLSSDNIEVSSFESSELQQFIITRVDDGYYRISPVSDSSLVVGVSDESVNNGSNVELSSYTESDSQKWEIKEVGDGYYAIINVNSGKSLDVYVAAGNVIQYSYWKGTNQQFELVNISGLTTGLNEESIASEDFVIYPNPTQDDIIVKGTVKNNCKVDIAIFNMQGKMVFEKNLGTYVVGQLEQKIQLNNISQGVYVVKLSTDNECQETLLIKK